MSTRIGVNRRGFLKTVAVAGLATQLTGEASAAGYSRAIPAGWTYPVAAELPATGFPEPAGYVGVAALVAAAFLTRERRDRT